MALYLVQHGKSLPREQDPEQGLSQDGTREVERIAMVANGYGIHVGRIQHSGKKRARQTAEILASTLNPPHGVKEIQGIGPLDDVTLLVPTLNSRDNRMLVGHLPFLERLTSYLLTGSFDCRIFKFQNGGIVALDQDLGNGSWYIKWALMPNIS